MAVTCILQLELPSRGITAYFYPEQLVFLRVQEACDPFSKGGGISEPNLRNQHRSQQQENTQYSLNKSHDGRKGRDMPGAPGINPR